MSDDCGFFGHVRGNGLEQSYEYGMASVPQERAFVIWRDPVHVADIFYTTVGNTFRIGNKNVVSIITY